MTQRKIDLLNSDKLFVGRSSYKEEKFSKVLKTVCVLKNPKKIIEFGILDGYSLECFIDSTDDSCTIEAYDIFEDFPYNSARYDYIMGRFNTGRVSIRKGDLFDSADNLAEESVDVLHVDIANNGEVYRYCIEKLIPKLRNDGVMLLEGGSIERDEVDWMIKYKKPKIREVIKACIGDIDLL